MRRSWPLEWEVAGFFDKRLGVSDGKYVASGKGSLGSE